MNEKKTATELVQQMTLEEKWSLSAYRDNLRNRREENPKAEPALDELEKSIVAHLADEVTIGIHGHRIRLVISKVIRSQI